MDSEKQKQNTPSPGKPGPGPGAIFFIVLAAVTLLAWALPLRPTVSEKEKRE